MGLDVIGAGFGRTGTMSLKQALEQLGFAPCYHMVEVFAHPGHAAVWLAAAKGEPTDWRAFFKDYRAAVDMPVAYFWHELADAFPDAKIVLTERDPDAWYDSMSKTILENWAQADAMADDPVRGPQLRMATYIVRDKTFGGRTDRAHAIAVLKAHNDAVKRAFPPDRLLVYDVDQGWAPLCKFLGTAVPDAPFPRTNSAEEFRARILKD